MYHPASNSLAERAVQSIKSILRKSPENLDDIGLGELCFAINNHVSQEGSGTNNERFLRRSVRTKIPNSINTKLNVDELVKQRINAYETRMKGKLKGRNKSVYLIGDRARLQNVKTKDFLLTGLRETDDHRVLSYDIQTDLGYETTHHRRFLLLSSRPYNS